MLTVPDPRPDEPARRPAAPMTSIQQYEAPSEPAGAPDDAAEAEPMAEQRAAEPAQAPDDAQARPAAGPDPRPARAAARVRPVPPGGADARAAADVQTTSGVPPEPIPDPEPPVEATSAPDATGRTGSTQQKTDKSQAQVEGESDKTQPEVEGETTDPEFTAVIELPDDGAAGDDSEAGAGDPEKTAVIRVPSPEETMVIELPQAPAGGPGEKTVVIRPATRDAAADETVVIKAPVRDRPADETAVILSRPADETVALPAGTVAPPAEVVTALIPVVPGRKDGKRTAAAGPPDPGRRPKPARPRREPLDLGHAPAVLTISALGVLMVALAYAGGRVDTGNAPFAYWGGQVVVFTPVVVRLLSRRMAGAAESFVLVMGLALNQYLLKWMYSPDQFRFPDELQHWLATTIIVQSGQLFQPNPALPPAVHFPGLAEMGAAVTSMTGLPVTAAGVIVAGVAHLVFVAVLFSAVLRASNSPAVAGVCCATYATALHYLFFNSMFLYQTAALPFFMLAIWATRRWRTEGGWPFLTLAVCCAGLTTVSHHVTAFALVLTLTLLAVAELVVQKPRRWSALIMPAIAAAVVALWLLTVARDVVGYLEAPVEQVGRTISDLVNGRDQAASTTAAVSVGQLVVQGTGLLGLFVLYVALVRDMIQRHDRDTWRWAAVAGGAIFFAGNGVRFLGQNGPEIAGRLSTFTYVPISILAAIALVRGVQIIPAKDAEGHRWRAAPPAIDVIAPGGWNLYSRVAAGSAMITLLMIGARAGGWPPLGSILPGPYLAGGFERSVDAYGVDAADWEHRALGPGNRVGGDVTSVSLASTYGRQDPVREVGPLYYADQWGLEQDRMVADLAIEYLVVDRRLSEQLPEGEAYFENDPNAGSITRPLTAAQISKFDSLTEVDRLYDNGTVRVYRMGVQ
ncbi:hypothetical protein COUCH_19255 [Couchioplanes caeruleus]|uniref:hypothetical protein n=1 Tax=Couchioplanes caeruleus TaxID=56438 RepID=UPI0020BDF585|nr:hypothetical protein [Couchioplanes caeruleus]UQU68291.1 hypothetical protein COUCH_19255 [Couchioplanes caeruleus]